MPTWARCHGRLVLRLGDLCTNASMDFAKNSLHFLCCSFDLLWISSVCPHFHTFYASFIKEIKNTVLRERSSHHYLNLEYEGPISGLFPKSPCDLFLFSSLSRGTILLKKSYVSFANVLLSSTLM